MVLGRLGGLEKISPGGYTAGKVTFGLKQSYWRREED